jgi:glycosyltransferase involved in cell wall biosynthesis
MKTWPKVSCVCITRNRRVFLRQAIEYFQRSRARYPGPAELVILDGSEKISSVWPARYLHRPSSIMQAGLAHNEVCEASSGDIIIQWDDDDWQHPDRIARQVFTLMQAPGDSFAYTSQYYWYHLEQRRAAPAKSWSTGEGSTGATFAYWKETWRKTPFEDITIGEDVPFQRALQDRGCPMLDAKDPSLLLYVRHNQNASVLTNYVWSDAATQSAREMVGPDLDFYDGIGELLPVANWNHPNAPGSKVHVMNPIQQLWSRHHR